MSQGGKTLYANHVWTPSWLVISLDGDCLVRANDDFAVRDNGGARRNVNIAGGCSYLELARHRSTIFWASDIVDRGHLDDCGG